MWHWAIGQLTIVREATQGLDRARELIAEFVERTPESASVWALRGRLVLIAGNMGVARRHLAVAQRFGAGLPVVTQLRDDLAAVS